MLESPIVVQLQHLNRTVQIVLASNSPRRRELLALGGWSFRARPAEVDETPRPGEAPDEYVMRLAEEKARVIGEQVPEALIVAADTTVADGGHILGKPADAREAREMLENLRGHSHQVFTGLAVYRPKTGEMLKDLAKTDVPMRRYTQTEIEAYIASGDPFDKAGGYAIQHEDFHPVESLAGCFANVMGLPLCHLTRALANLDLRPSAKVPEACQNALDYDCPVFEQILQGEL